MRRLGAVVVTAGAAVLARWLAGTGLGVADTARRGVPLGPDEAILGLLAVTAAAGLAWLVVGVLLEALARVPGATGRVAGSWAAAVSPRVVRRVAAVVVGVGIGTAAGGGVGASPALAATVPPGSSLVVRVVAGAGGGGEPASAPLPDPGFGPAPGPGWVPARPTVRPHPDVASVSATGRRDPVPETHVVVHRGDSLWSLAARHLGPGATDREVADEWPRWYAANREVIGPDPDLVLPGQVLHPPASEDAR